MIPATGTPVCCLVRRNSLFRFNEIVNLNYKRYVLYVTIGLDLL